MTSGPRLRGYVDAALVLGCEASLAVFFWKSAPFLGSVDFAHFGHWLGATSPGQVLSALVRLLGLTISLWLVVSTCAYAVGVLGGHQGIVRRSRRVTLPVVRRVVDALAVATVAASTLSTSAGSALASEALRTAVAEPLGRPGMVVMPSSRPVVNALARAAATAKAVAALPNIGRELPPLGDQRVSTGAVGRHFPHPGMLPHVPPAKAALPARSGAVPSFENGFAGLPKGTKVVVVQPGDCLSVIAERYLGDWRLDTEIEALNYGRPQPDGLSLVNDHWIYPGWVLIMPDDAVGTLVVGETAPPHAASAPRRGDQHDGAAPQYGSTITARVADRRHAGLTDGRKGAPEVGSGAGKQQECLPHAPHPRGNGHLGPEAPASHPGELASNPRGNGHLGPETPASHHELVLPKRHRGEDGSATTGRVPAGGRGISSTTPAGSGGMQAGPGSSGPSRRGGPVGAREGARSAEPNPPGGGAERNAGHGSEDLQDHHDDLETLALAGIGAVAAAGVMWRIQRWRRELAHLRPKGWVAERNRPQVEAAERRARVVASEEAMRWVDLAVRYLGALVEQAAYELRGSEAAGPLLSTAEVEALFSPAGDDGLGEGHYRDGASTGGPGPGGGSALEAPSAATAGDSPGDSTRDGSPGNDLASEQSALGTAERRGPQGISLAQRKLDGAGAPVHAESVRLDLPRPYGEGHPPANVEDAAFERWWKGESGAGPADAGASFAGAPEALSSQLPSLVLARVGACGLEVVLAPAPAGRFGWFSPSPGGGEHFLDGDVGLDDLETLGAERWSPWPALVELGEADGSAVLFNLEHAGVLSVEGPPERVEGFLAGVALQLASQPWADEMLGGLYLVGSNPLGEHLVGRVQHVDAAGAMDLAERLDGIATARQQLAGQRSLSVLRALACEALPHVAVVFEGTPPGSVRCLAEAAVPERSGVVLAAAGPVGGAKWRLVLDEGAGATLEGWAGGREVKVQLASAVHAEEVALLSEAVDGRGDEELVEVESVPSSNGNGSSAHAAAPIEKPERGEVEIRLLGPVDVAGGYMETLDSGRIMATLGLLAYLAAHRRPVTAEELASSLWPLDATRDNFGGPQRKTVMNVVSRARSVLGYGPNGKERLVLTPQGYRLTSEVTSDWARFEKHVSMARALSAGEAALHLREALELVRGEPFGGAMASQFFEWVASEHLDMTMAGKVVDVAQDLGEVALEAGDYPTVYWAVDKGLLLEPTREELFRLWMHALGRSGRPAKVDDVYRRLKLVLRQRIHPLEEPQPESREVWRTYTAAHSVAGRPGEM